MSHELARMPRDVRMRRFWQAHGRSFTHLAVLRVLSIRPEIAWTPDMFRLWYGIRPGRAKEILDELAACGIALARGSGVAQTYAWNPALDWALPIDVMGRMPYGAG